MNSSRTNVLLASLLPISPMDNLRMTTLKPLIPFAALCLLAGCASDLVSTDSKSPAVANVYRVPFDPAIVDREIDFHRARVRRDPEGAVGWAMLSGAYLKRSRVYDSDDDARAAEAAARRSIEIRRTRNAVAASRLVQALLDQHRFQDALGAAKDALRIAPTDANVIKLAVDSLYEVGRYDAANKLFQASKAQLDDISREEITARFEELSGKRNHVLERISRVITAARAHAGIDAATMSSLHTRKGDLLATTGKLKEAEAEYRAALALNPANWKALGAMVELATARKDWDAVIGWGQKAEKLVTMPEQLSLMGDAYAAKGDAKRAEEYFGKVVAASGYGPVQGLSHRGPAHPSALVKSHGHPLGRQFAVFAADHGRNLDDALRAAKADLTQRQDYLAYETLAWVHFKRSELKSAKKYIDKALKKGRHDPRVLMHAAQIYRSFSPSKAYHFAQAAAAISPHLNRN